MRAIWMVVLAFSLSACGGMEAGDEALSEGAENSVQTEQVSSELAGVCESLVGTFCRPGAVTHCTWSDGAEGECECQRTPFNKWLCSYNG
ncbi:hypothetical protein HUA74_44240 [Myxococcus sp. CA051A]|uniref:hypothetical protein n=1 Tax=unclassified Myxococcus TaxID=2648731 RepID=UPI00157A8DF2|nr:MULTISPECIES: hypothetical protein [unclassified Myxococcus]NTX37509.1 hypothetical protein [Myxococcus sp. CA033]NTX67680.1 hypothetical protein [Myxococcus sp. CA051A]